MFLLEFHVTQVLVQHPGNLYAANGAGVVSAEKGHFDVSKDIFTQVSGPQFLHEQLVLMKLMTQYVTLGINKILTKLHFDSKATPKDYCFLYLA